MEQFGAGSGWERVETLPESALELIRTHGENTSGIKTGSKRPPSSHAVNETAGRWWGGQDSTCDRRIMSPLL